MNASEPDPTGLDFSHYPFGKRIAVAAVAGVLLSIAVLTNDDLIASYLSEIFTLVCQAIGYGYTNIELSIKQPGLEQVFALQAQTAEIRYFDSRILPAAIDINSSTLIGHSLQSLVLFYTLFTLLPLKSIQAWLIYSAISIPVILLVLALDVPFVLIGALEDLVLSHFDPESLSYSPSVQWMHLMNSGGRLVLPIVAIAGIFIMQHKQDKNLSQNRHLTAA